MTKWGVTVLAMLGLMLSASTFVGCQWLKPRPQTRIVKITATFATTSPKSTDSLATSTLASKLLIIPYDRTVTSISGQGKAEIYVAARTTDSPKAVLAAVSKIVDKCKHLMPNDARIDSVVLMPRGSSIPNVPIVPIQVADVRIDAEKAASAGVRPNEISECLAQASSKPAATQSSSPLAGLTLQSSRGGLVKLEDVATVEYATEPSHVVTTYP